MRAVHHQLIRSLVSNSPQTAATLAETLDVSVRSVRTYVREINTSCPGILTSTPVGYTIDRNLAADVLKTDDGERFGSSKERSDYIVNHLIVQPDGDPIDLWDLCDEMSVSMSTLKTDLARAKRTLARNDLELVTHRDRISLNGTERNKRKLLSGMLRQETNNGFMGTGALSRAFPDIDIKSVQQLVSDTLYRHHRFINDYALSDLLLHLAISIDRIRRSESLDAGDTADLPEEDRTIACELAYALGASLSIEFPAEELRELTLLIMARSTDIDYRSATESNLAELIGTDCMALVEKLTAQFNELYGIDLSDRGFLVRFGLHVRGLLVRARTQKPSRNPLTESVKTGCPLIYDAAVALASTITNDLGVTINDDEIAYIALHLGSAVGTQREADAKAKATIFCPSYYDMGPRLVEQLAERFGEQLMITRIATDEAELTDCPDDLVICISPIQSVLQVPTLQIAPVPSSTDIANLRARSRASWTHVSAPRSKTCCTSSSILRSLRFGTIFPTAPPASNTWGAAWSTAVLQIGPISTRYLNARKCPRLPWGHLPCPIPWDSSASIPAFPCSSPKSPSNGRIRRSTSFSCCALARRSARRSTRYSTAWRALSSNPPTYVDFWNAHHTKPSSTRSPAWPIRLTATFPLGGYLLRIDGAVLERPLDHGAPPSSEHATA